MADMASEKQIRDGGGVATESAILGDRWSEAAGSALYWQNYRGFGWLAYTPKGLDAYIWRYYPKAQGFPLGLIVDEMPNRADDARLPGNVLRRDAAAAEASRRSDAAAAAGIGYVATFVGEQSDAEASVAGAREKVAAIGVRFSDERMPTPPDADPGAYAAEPGGNDGVTGGLKISGLDRRPARGEG